MKKILSTALVAFALIGTVSAASAGPVPGKDASISENLAFWSQFGND